jgi:hypothetical protein
MRIPELCVAILEQIDGFPLAAAARICRDWMRLAISVQPSHMPLYQLTIRHPDNHAHTRPSSRVKRPHAGDERDACSDKSELAEETQLKSWRFPRLQSLMYLHCKVWCGDAGNNNNGTGARQLAGLISR